MERERTFDCLCLKSIDYKENDKLITLYAFGEGKITASLRGVKKPKAKLRYAQALLCFGKYYFTSHNGFNNVIGCDLIDNFYGIWTDIDKYYAAMCCLEILDKVADDREIGDKVAVMTLEFLNDICYKSNNVYLSFCKFLYNTIKILGYNIAPVCVNCNDDKPEFFYYSYIKCGIVCKNCRESNALPLSEKIIKLIKSLYINDFGSCFDIENGEILSLIKLMFDIISKNLHKNFKTFEEYISFYNKINI